MNLEEKKLEVDKIKIKIDIVKTSIDAIHKKILIFLAVGTGSWIYGVQYGNSESILLNLFSLILFLIFFFIATGTIVSLFKLSKFEQELKNLKKELEHVK